MDLDRDQWWMVEIEALRAKMKVTIDEVKTRNNDVRQILKVIQGVQDTLNVVSGRVPHVSSTATPSPQIPLMDRPQPTSTKATTDGTTCLHPLSAPPTPHGD